MHSVNLILPIVIVAISLNFAESVQYYNYAVPVPAVGKWRTMTDGYQFRTQDFGDGSYHFGYDTGDKKNHKSIQFEKDTGTQYDKSYREERRDAQGRIHGRYGYVDPTGILRSVEYVADEHGFRLRSSESVPFDNSNIQIIGPIPIPIMRKLHNKEIKSDYAP